MGARRCLGCSTLIASGSYCARCTRAAKKVRNADRRIAAAVVAASPRCGRCGTTEDLTADHVIPLAKGGRNTGPRQVLCRPCNSKKKDRL